MKNARTIKQLKAILDETYGSHMGDAVRRVDIDNFDFEDEDLDQASWESYLLLRFTLESNRTVGISLQGMRVLDVIILGLHDLAVKKSMIPSISTNRAVPYMVGFELARALLNSDSANFCKECLRVIKSFAEIWADKDFVKHLHDYETEVSVTSYEDAQWLLAEFHEFEESCFVAGIMNGISGQSVASIEVNRILESISNIEEEVE
ncbi:MAG: hypothetical protein ACPHX8_07530 [Candidatus Poseidoniaceae archaeon]